MQNYPPQDRVRRSRRRRCWWSRTGNVCSSRRRRARTWRQARAQEQELRWAEVRSRHAARYWKSQFEGCRRKRTAAVEETKAVRRAGKDTLSLQAEVAAGVLPAHRLVQARRWAQGHDGQSDDAGHAPRRPDRAADAEMATEPAAADRLHTGHRATDVPRANHPRGRPSAEPATHRRLQPRRETVERVHRPLPLSDVACMEPDSRRHSPAGMGTYPSRIHVP